MYLSFSISIVYNLQVINTLLQPLPSITDVKDRKSVVLIKMKNDFGFFNTKLLNICLQYRLKD